MKTLLRTLAVVLVLVLPIGAWGDSSISNLPLKSVPVGADVTVIVDSASGASMKAKVAGILNAGTITTTLDATLTAPGPPPGTTIIVPPGTHNLSSSIDRAVLAGVALKPMAGAVIVIPNGRTLTINGTLDAGLYQIFSCTGTGAVKFSATSPQTDIYPEWWGAVGDGDTDDLAALNACRDSMVTTSGSWNYGRGVMHLSRWYTISSTFSVDLIGNSNTTGMIFRGVGKYNSGFIAGSSCDNKPVVEILGSPNIEISNFGIAGMTKTPEVGYAGTVAPSVGLLLARANGTGGGNGYNSRIIDIGFWGYFRFGNLYNWGYSDTIFHGIQTWTSPINTTPKQWMFEFFNGDCSKTRKFTDIVGTNAEILTSPAAYGGGENNKFYNVYTYTSNDSWKAAGAAGIYSFGYAPYCEKVFLGGSADYQYYCLNANISIKDCSGDGTGTIAGIYMASDAEATGWPSACAAEADVRNYTNQSTTAYAFMTDANTELKESTLYHLRGNNNLKILLGKGATNSRFEANGTMTSFVVTAGLFYYNYLDIPFTCAEYQIDPSVIYNCIIDDQRYTSTSLNLGGNSDVRIGSPYGGLYSSSWPCLMVGPFKITWRIAAPTEDHSSWMEGSIIWRVGAAAGTSPGWIVPTGKSNTIGTLNSGATTGTITTGTKLLTVNSVTGLAIGNFIDVVADGGGNAVAVGRITNINPTTKVVTLADNATGTATAKAVSYHNETTANAFKAMANMGP